MLTLNIGDTAYSIKFGYEATLKSRLLSKIAKAEQNATDNSLESVEDMLLLLPEILLAGLQKFHKDEFGYNFDNAESKEEMLSKAFSLIDTYLEDENNDAMELFNSLQTELTSDGFLASLFRKEQAKAEEQAKKASKSAKK